jgi:hypothetical protein
MFRNDWPTLKKLLHGVRGSVSDPDPHGSAWIRKRVASVSRIRKRFASWIRIRLKNADPDTAAGKFVLRAKSQGSFKSKS